MKGLAALLLAAACQNEAAGPAPAPPAPPSQKPAPLPVQTDVSAEDYVMGPLPRGRVTLLGADGGRHPVEVEIAATDAARTRGLMWRWALAEGKGMLFIFKEPRPLSFWMKNTLIPLDMIFIDPELKVAGVVENAEPRTLSSRGIAAPTLFVLEVPGGFWAKSGLKPGSAVKLEGAADQNVE